MKITNFKTPFSATRTAQSFSSFFFFNWLLQSLSDFGLP